MTYRLVRASIATATLIASAQAADAHIVASRLGDFYTGALHPLTDLQDLILWVAMGVLAGSLGASKGRWLAWRSQPVPHDFSPAQRAVKHDGYLAGATTWQYALYNVHVPYNVHALQLQFASSLADSLQSFAIDRRTVPAERKSA